MWRYSKNGDLLCNACGLIKTQSKKNLEPKYIISCSCGNVNIKRNKVNVHTWLKKKLCKICNFTSVNSVNGYSWWYSHQEQKKSLQFDVFMGCVSNSNFEIMSNFEKPDNPFYQQLENKSYYDFMDSNLENEILDITTRKRKRDEIECSVCEMCNEECIC
jgi:hypothetical protein